MYVQIPYPKMGINKVTPLLRKPSNSDIVGSCTSIVLAGVLFIEVSSTCGSNVSLFPLCRVSRQG